MITNDPETESKRQRELELRAALLHYFEGLQARVIEMLADAVQEDNYGPTTG